MGELRQRTKIDKGIYRDRYGLAATVKAGGVQREKRYPPDTSIKTIKAWQTDTRSALQKLAPGGGRGTFAADAAKYLRAVSTMPTFKEREAHVALWTAEFGPRTRHTIKTVDIDIVLSRWLTAGLSPSAVRNRRTALLSLFSTLDAGVPGAINPVRGALLPRMPEATARALSYATIARILAAMPDRGQGIAGQARDSASKTKARIAVIAYTGLPHGLLKALRPTMVDWQGKAVTVPARRKGAGVARRTLPLSDAGVAALRHFDALDCWGTFSNSSMLKSFRRACKAADVKPIPRVYDLRHSFATEMYRLTGDAKATAQLLMHSDQSHMMDRYTVGGVQPRALVAVDAFNVARAKRLAVAAGSETSSIDAVAEAS
jgi:integrase